MTPDLPTFPSERFCSTDQTITRGEWLRRHAATFDDPAAAPDGDGAPAADGTTTVNHPAPMRISTDARGRDASDKGTSAADPLNDDRPDAATPDLSPH